LKIKQVSFDSSHAKMIVQLINDCSLIVPIKLYSKLNNAPVQKLLNFRLTSSGVGIHWPDLDEDLSLKGFINDFLKQSLNTGKELVIAA